jgi:hypothetical protein
MWHEGRRRKGTKGKKGEAKGRKVQSKNYNEEWRGERREKLRGE